ncbi:MAG: phycobilisome rod-core linker polypeptide [Promethearchaeota archaeon]
MSELEPLVMEWPIEQVPNLIKRIFRQVLEREYTPVELIDYGSMLDRGERSIKETIRELALSEEYEDRFIEPYPEETRVNYCFNHLLNRDPTPDELEEYKEISVDEGIDNVINLILDNSDLYDPGDNGIAFEKGLITSGIWIYLKANNSLFVCAENGGGREVIANRYKPLGWETFTIRKVGGDGVISVNDTITFQVSNGMFFCEGSWLDQKDILALRFNNNIAQSYRFIIEKVSGEVGEICDGDVVRLKARGGKYICTDSNNQRLYANCADTSDNRIQFTINIQYLR